MSELWNATQAWHEAHTRLATSMNPLSFDSGASAEALSDMGSAVARMPLSQGAGLYMAKAALEKVMFDTFVEQSGHQSVLADSRAISDWIDAKARHNRAHVSHSQATHNVELAEEYLRELPSDDAEARARFKGVLEGYQFESRGAERSGSEAATALLEAESRVFSNCATSTDRRLEWM